MKLMMSYTSPYARKVRVCAFEKGLMDRIGIVETVPLEDPDALHKANPLGKVPALVLEDGTALYDSPVICDYIDSLGDTPKLVPASGPDRFHVLRRQALADGILDACVARLIERFRPEAEQSKRWLGRYENAILRAFDVMDQEVALLGSEVTLAHITFGCATAYADFRHPDLDWRQGRPRLADWDAQFSERPSMTETRPPQS